MTQKHPARVLSLQNGLFSGCSARQAVVKVGLPEVSFIRYCDFGQSLRIESHPGMERMKTFDLLIEKIHE